MFNRKAENGEAVTRGIVNHRDVEERMTRGQGGREGRSTWAEKATL